MVNDQDTSLEALLERAQAGDLEAYGGIVSRQHARLRGFLGLLGVQGSWLDDLEQEIFVAAWAALPRWDKSRPFIPWLNGVARNIVHRHQARQARERRHRSGFLAQWMQAHPIAEEAEPDHLIDRLRVCLERLPQHLRDLVRMRYVEEVDAEELARRNGRDGASVRMSLMRTRRTLHDCLMAGDQA